MRKILWTSDKEGLQESEEDFLERENQVVKPRVTWEVQKAEEKYKEEAKQVYIEQQRKEKLEYSFRQVVDDPKAALDKLKEAEAQEDNEKDLKIPAASSITFTCFVQPAGQVMENIPTYIQVNEVNRKLIRTSVDVITNQKLERLIWGEESNSDDNEHK